ncbi:MAG: hydrogenase maturation nickel metallochaperone HypA [Bacillota bacterium]
MHELALAQNLLNIVNQAAQENQLSKVTTISVIWGELMGIVPDALQFGFEVSSADTPAQGAVLLHKELPALIRCSSCNHEFPWKAYGYSCPQCSRLGGEMFQGQEFYVEYIEGDGKEENINGAG